jgi:hypothetical protein
MDSRDGLNCIWVGPTTGGLGWLREQMLAWQFDGRTLSIVHESTLFEPAAVEKAVCAGIDRIVLSCSERMNYPAEAVSSLLQAYPEVPLAVATDNWWDGSRRTGLGTVDHLLLPWYRWWDSWVDWLAARSAGLFGPCQLPTPLPQRRRAVVALPPAPTHGSTLPGYVVANCRQTAQAWMGVAQALGCQVTAMSSAAFRSHLFDRHREKASAWVLWDDSCLDTASGPQAADEQLRRFFDDLGQQWPEAAGMAALSLPRHDSWQAIQSTKPANAVRELIAKPSNGSSLHNCLTAKCGRPSSNAVA